MWLSSLLQTSDEKSVWEKHPDPRRLILAAVISAGWHQRIHRSTASLPSLLEFPRDPDCPLQASSIQGASQPLTAHAQFLKG